MKKSMREMDGISISEVPAGGSQQLFGHGDAAVERDLRNRAEDKVANSQSQYQQNVEIRLLQSLPHTKSR